MNVIEENDLSPTRKFSRQIGNFYTASGYLVRSTMAENAMVGTTEDEKSLSYRTALQHLGLNLVEFSSADSLDGDYPPEHVKRAPSNILIHTGKDLIVVWRRIDQVSRRIVCAAIRGKSGGVILSVRHHDSAMSSSILSRKDAVDFIHLNSEDEGFVDNYGIFLTRKEAFVIAERSGKLKSIAALEHDGYSDQLRRRWLFSEMIY